MVRESWGNIIFKTQLEPRLGGALPNFLLYKGLEFYNGTSGRCFIYNSNCSHSSVDASQPVLLDHSVVFAR